jgi:iron complex outermembrane recepter protein
MGEMIVQKVSPLIGVLLLLPPALVEADASTDAAIARGSDELTEIVVTAQRRQESLQSVPISISAFTAEDISRSDMNEARDYLSMAPNVSFADDGQTGNRSIRIAIRGVSNISLGDRAVPNALGFYIDDFNVGTVANGTINPALLDVKQVEVLRGPQGTYYGRNSSGGAINITNNLPDNSWFTEVAAYGGNYNTNGGRIIVNAPVSDTFFLRGVIGFESSNGTVKNVNPAGTPNSGYDQTDARLSARWLINDRFTADATLTYMHDAEGMDADVNTGVLELDTIGIEGPGFRPISDGLGFYPQNQNLVNHGIPEWNRNDLEEANVRLTYEFDNFTLKSITGDIKTTNSRMFDEDAVSVDAIYRNNEWKAESYGEELRLQSKAGGALDWVVGALYARDQVRQFNLVATGPDTTYTYPDTGQTVSVLPPVPPNLPINENTTGFDDDSAAIYGEVTWRPIAPWAFTVGGRYTRDTINDTQTGVFSFGSPEPNLAGGSSFNDFSPHAVVSYNFTSDDMAYVSASHGYKAGGHDLNDVTENAAGTIIVPTVTTFQPEKVWNYEVGYKSEFWDHRAMFDASAFYIDWKNLQAEENYLAIPGDIASAVQSTVNAASATSKGIDMQARVRPIQPLTLGASLGLLDAKFGSFPNANVYGYEVNLSGDNLPQSPHVTANALVEWAEPVNVDTNWYIRYEEVYRSSSESNLEGVAAVSGQLAQYGVIGTFPFKMPSYEIGNLNAGLTSKGWSLLASADNVFNKEYYTGTGDHFGFGGVRVRPHPRMWKLELVYRTH